MAYIQRAFNIMSSEIKLCTSSQVLKEAVSNLYHFEDFRLEFIGSGAYADVFKATHIQSNKVMVVKKPKKQVHQPIMTRESELLVHFSHPNVIKAFGVIIEDGLLSIVMEYINGGSLQNYIKNEENILPWSTRIKLALDISDGMGYIHQMGYFHRDLTSLNVLIKINSNCISAIVSDLGLATRIPCKGNILKSVGTPYCRAPENISGKFYNEKADVFSFGIILCEMIIRCDYESDHLPRTCNFGVDYLKFGDIVEDCPIPFLYLTFHCCQINPESRMSFNEIGYQLENVILDYINYGLLSKTPDFPSETKDIDRWSSMDDLQRIKNTNYSACKNMDFAEIWPYEEASDFFPKEKIKDLCPKEIGEIMTRVDPEYTSKELNFESIVSQMTISENHEYIDKTIFENTYEFQHKKDTKIHSLPYTKEELHKIANQCLRNLPSDKNLMKESCGRKNNKRKISRTLIHSMRNHGITLPIPIINCQSPTTISDGDSTTGKRSLIKYSKNLFHYSLDSSENDLTADFINNFFRQDSSNSFTSSFLSSDVTESNIFGGNESTNERFDRFKKRYLIACLKTQLPTSQGQVIPLTDETLQRMNEAREMFKKYEEIIKSRSLQ